MTKDVQIKSSWDDVTVGEYQRLLQLTSMEWDEPIDMQCHRLAILSNQDFEFFQTITFEDFIRCLNAIEFSNHVPEPSALKHKYHIGGETYKIGESVSRLRECPISALKSIHYIDLVRELNKEADVYERLQDLHNMLSIMLIPDGQEYGNEGYSISENAKLLQEHMTIRDALAVSAFFLILWEGLTTGLKRSLEREVKKLTKKGIIDKKEAERMLMTCRTVMKLSHQAPSLINGVGKR